MPTDPFVLYLGLRRSPLEWRAELDAATVLGYDVLVTSDVSLDHTGLPADRTSRFEWADTAAATAAAIVDGLPAKPAAVLCWGDRYALITAHIAEALGLRGVGVDAAAGCADKAAQRRVLEPHGLNPRWRAGGDLADLRAAVAEFDGPVVFKLAHSSGGRGTAVVTVDSDLTRVLAATDLNYQPSTSFVVEEFIDGTEHSVTGVVADGRVTVFGVSDKGLGTGLRTHTTVFPSVSPDEGALIAAATTAVEAVGMVSGGFHVDLRWTDRGPVVLEVGGRLGGDLINSHLVPLATGDAVEPYQSLIEVLTTGVVREPAKPTAAAAMTVITGGRGGGEDLARLLGSHPNIELVSGWPQPSAPDLAVVITADTAAAAAGIADQVRRW